MEQVGYQLVDSSGHVVQSWGGDYGQCPGVPEQLTLPNGDQVHCPQLDVAYDGLTLVIWNTSKPVQTVFDGQTFLSRIADSEYLAVMSSGDTNVLLARWLELLRLTNSIDVTSVKAQAAKAALVTANLLTQARADVVFATA